MFDHPIASSTRNTNSATRPSSPTNNPPGVVLSQIHVSCFITAANRATPVFEVVPERNCIRMMTKASGETSSLTSAASGNRSLTSSGSSFGSSSSSPTAEWEFHKVFTSASSLSSHANEFYQEITLPAFRNVCDGVNTNIVSWGVHPTQKFRLLFGKSTGNIQLPQSTQQVADEQKILELHGQIGGLLDHFFSKVQAAKPIMSGSVSSHSSQLQSSTAWRLGISSWIIVNNHVTDLLKPCLSSSSSSALNFSESVSTTATPLSFVSLEAKSFASACRIIQMAKTNRIVMKQNAEHAHFFLRLAFFHQGQVSTLHFSDLIDLKDFKDPISIQEKQELYEILHEIRRLLGSPTKAPGTQIKYTQQKMVLSNFILPLLTANAKTFLYTNVIDSRTNLRESVQLLNAVANIKGFACVCKRLSGIEFIQLGFQSAPDDVMQIEATQEDSQQREATADTGTRTRAAVAVNESLLTQLASSSGLPSPFPSPTPSLTTFPTIPSLLSSSTTSASQGQQPRDIKFSSSTWTTTPVESEAMSWLETFTQRKREILGGKIDSITPVSKCPLPAKASMCIHSEVHPLVELPVYSVSAESSPNAPFQTHHPAITSVSAEQHEEHGQSAPASSLNSNELYERLRESMAANKFRNKASNRGSPPPPSMQDPKMLQPSRAFDGGRRLLNTQDNISWSCDEIVDQSPLSPPLSQTEITKVEDDRSSLFTPQVHSNTSNHQASAYDRSSSISTARPARKISEVFDRANVPSQVMAPPNVDGLDVVTANKIQATDAALLRKNYDALLTIVQEQQELREAAEARAAEAQHDQEELRAMFEIQIENMKLANVSLRSKVRALEKQTALPKVFEQYEQELQSLHNEVQQLRTRNVALELKVAGSDGCSGPGSISDIKKKYQQAMEEKQNVERELMEYRRKERQFQVHSKLVGDSTRRVDQLSRALSDKEEALVATRLGKLRLNAEVNQAQEQADLLHQENRKLLLEKAATTEELLATKMYLASLENEQKKADILDRFVKKHGDRMSRLKQNDPVGGSTGKGDYYSGQQLQRSSHEKECEEKLFNAIKRSLPQAVPLANRLLRRLEMQEVSLREYSEREVDFINLLVELVSDQPAVSLKNMIEEEMKKLHAC